MPITAYGDIDQRTAAWVSNEMLEYAQRPIVLGKLAKVKDLPKNKARSLEFRRVIPLATATTPLTEGVTPTPTDFRYEDIPVTLNQYGDHVEITDVISDMAEDPVLKDASEALGEQAGATTEEVTFGVIKAGTNVQFANGALRSAVNTPLTINLQRAVIRTLKANKGRKITSVQDGSVKIGTKPIEGAYIAVCHTDMEADIRALPGFISVAEYGVRKTICPEEIGSVEDVRYITSPELTAWADAGGLKSGSGTEMVSTTGTSADVYPVIFLAKDAFATSALKGKRAIHPIVLKPGVARGSDPLAQRGSVGWKTYFAAAILNQAWMVRAEVASTAL